MSIPVPLNPEGAAWHACVVQGGFSTPAIEAFRILHDALMTVRHDSGVGLDDRWKRGVRDTLAWLDAHEGSEVAAARHDFELRRAHPDDWRALLEEAV